MPVRTVLAHFCESALRCAMLPWFQDRFPLYLAPMAGVTDTIFRQLCKEYGADVMVTEFVSAEGIFRSNERTLEYLEFVEAERPLGVQLFGGDPEHLGEAARMVARLEAARFHRPEFRLPGEQGGVARTAARRCCATARCWSASRAAW